MVNENTNTTEESGPDDTTTVSADQIETTTTPSEIAELTDTEAPAATDAAADTEAPSAAEPAADEPVADEPVADETVVAEPVAEEAPVTEEAPVAEPAPAEPAADADTNSTTDTEVAAPVAEDAAAEAEAEPAKDAAAETEPATAESAVAEPAAPIAEEEPAASIAEAAPDAAASAPVEAEAVAVEAEVPAAEPLLPEPFVSAPSTRLVFLAPDLPPLPARGHGDDHDDFEDDAFGSSRRTPRRRNDDRRDDRRDGRDTDRRRNDDRDDRDDREERTSSTRTRTREPREVPLITEPQKIKGSTRLEAKKQRRRDGRDAGRRRTVVTEAEFLARRESVDRTMVVREKDRKIQIGVLEDKVLVEHYVARNEEASLIGNVYLGRVQNVLPSMEAAFVDIGRGRNAVLYSGEVDWDSVKTSSNQARRIENALKPGDKVLVQVTKDPVGHKGARLTSQVSLPGRYLVYVPNGSMSGISRKLPDTERARLKKILKEVLPENVGVIVRTAAEGATEEQLTLDVSRLTGQWTHISEQVAKANAPALLHSEPDLLIKIVRDVFNEDFQKMVIAGDDARETIQAYLTAVAPDLVERVERYEGSTDVFDEYRVTEQIEKALDRKVWLPSGGSLVIDRTEAMTVIDVNTGKFVGSGGNLEETVTKNNLEAAEEIVRQLRLRDIGGIIVVDFIDMVLETNRDLVLRRVIECLSRDRTKHQVAEVTSLGLVQMTRKKLGLGLLESFSEPCETCAGRGVIVHHDPVTRHVQTPQPEARRRGKGNGSNGNQQAAAPAPVQAPAPAKAPTHAITDDAKNALAQIAASTLPAGETPADTNAEQAPTEGRRKRRRGGRNRDAENQPTASDELAELIAEAPEVEVAAPVEAVIEAPAPVSVETPAEEAEPERPARARRGRAGREQDRSPRKPDHKPLLEIPAESVRKRHKVDVKTAEDILGSVLDSLPEPKEPGKGRNRSRRVSTPAISTAPVKTDGAPSAE